MREIRLSSSMSGVWKRGCKQPRHIPTLLVRSRHRSTLPSDPASRRRPCASLALHLHQVVQGTCTPRLSNMLGTQLNRFAVGSASRGLGLLSALSLISSALARYSRAVPAARVHRQTSPSVTRHSPQTAPL